MYSLPALLDLSTNPPDLHQSLVLLLVTGERDIDLLIANSPMDEPQTRQIVEELLAAGHVVCSGVAPSGDEEGAEPTEPPEPASPTGAWINPRSKKGGSKSKSKQKQKPKQRQCTRRCESQKQWYTREKIAGEKIAGTANITAGIREQIARIIPGNGENILG